MAAILDQMGPLGEVLEAVQGFEANPGELTKFRVAFARNYTLESIEPLLKYLAYKSGLQPEVTIGDYDNIRQEVLNTESHLYTSKPDVVVLSFLLEHLDPASQRSGWNPELAQSAILSTLSDLMQRSTALIVVNTLIPPLHAENALLAPSLPDHRVSQVQAINTQIRAFAAQNKHQVFVADFERLLSRLGEERSIDYRFWYMSRAPFKKEFLSHYAWDIVRLGLALKGKRKKCLVLDCDNTIWGGVVGEEGPTGIALDPFEYPGRCFYDFQKSVRNLIDQGIIVALCSKNNEADVLEVIDSHPHSLLRRANLAAWRVNWNDKASNIRELAEELNLGLDSFVFVDDSSVECELVRGMIPEVTVIQAPKAVFGLPQLLYRDGLFDGLMVSAEDAARTASYVAERGRSESKSAFASQEEYLTSLELKAVIHEATDTELPRVAQLLGKTNQFNLTTRRHSEALVREFSASPDAAIYTLAASDRFGDLGLVGALIAIREGEDATVDTLLMSCRALGRNLELAFVEHCLSELEKRWNPRSWRCAYLPTKKNGQVAEFWDSLGFSRSGAVEGGIAYQQAVLSRKRQNFPFIHISAKEPHVN
jgi:FkbH-like protein